MTYGNEQGWFEIRNTFCRLSDEFMDFVIGGPQVRRLLGHPRRELQDGAFRNRRSVLR